MKKNGFTLAEVLITLGIIGIVAAMTLPSILANQRKKVAETRLAKVYSVMNQAINMNIAEYGDYKNWIKDCGASTAITCTTDDLLQWYNEYLGKQIKSTKVEKVTIPQNGILIYLADGSLLLMPDCIYDIKFYVDKKAITNPIAGKNLFAFRMNPFALAHQQNEPGSYITTSGKGFEPYSWQWDGTREGLIEGKNAGQEFGCAFANPTPDSAHNGYCTKLIQMNGWKIPDDYPLKF